MIMYFLNASTIQRAIDFYEFLEWRKLFKCKAGLAHTDIFKLGERYGLDIIKILRDNDIFGN